MSSPSRERAENRFATVQKRQLRALTEHEEAAKAIDDNMARLKALRLAREAQEQADSDTRKQLGAKKLMARRAVR